MIEQRPFLLGDWQVIPERRLISNGETERSLEPKVLELLILLASEPGRVISRHDIEQSIWGNIVIGEDTVARLVSKLRRAFSEKAHAPKYIETIPKRGYRLMQTPRFDAVSLEITAHKKASFFTTKLFRIFFTIIMAVFVFSLAGMFILNKNSKTKTDQFMPEIARANDLYMKFTYLDNETAIKLYEKVLSVEGDNAVAQAGLANALVQRVVRWPDGKPISLIGTDSLQDALNRNLHLTEFGQSTLERASGLAERSARRAPNNADVLKALGLTYTAQGRIDEAEAVYEKAITLDSNAWEAMINLGEIYKIKTQESKSLALFAQAYEAMERSYIREPQKVAQWQAPLGNTIARLHHKQGRSSEAEIWYRRVLALSPLNENASVELANILRLNGDSVQANTICQELKARLGDVHKC